MGWCPCAWFRRWGRMTDFVISERSVEHWTAQRRNAASESGGAAAAFRAPGMSRERKRRPANLVPLAFGIAVVAVLWIGWLDRADNGLTPESGVGYWLGIAGSGLMLLLLLYPLRKRVKFSRLLGSVAFWFRVHMILGVVGPVLILLHANFRLGSINSNMALAAMLVVAVSGIVGRYLYGKIHLGLYGRKAEVQEILADADKLKAIVGADLAVTDRVVTRLNEFAQFGTTAPRGCCRRALPAASRQLACSAAAQTADEGCATDDRGGGPPPWMVAADPAPAASDTG